VKEVVVDQGRYRPDADETDSQRARYDAAQESFRANSERIDQAANRLSYSREEFHSIEDEFLALVEELRRTDRNQIRNLAHLEGLRIRLLSSFDDTYRHAVNELADAMLQSIGIENDAQGSD
jgi:hypothetical protein